MLGLPLHPVIVHFAVVLLMLLPLATLASLVWKGLRERLDWLLPAGAVLAGICGLVAGSSGEELYASMPATTAVDRHASFGQITEKAGLAFGLVVVVWWLATSPTVATWAERRAPWLRSTGARVVTTVVMGLVSVGTLVLVTLTGHAGGVAVWGGR